MDEEYRIIKLKGFHPDNEPEIRVYPSPVDDIHVVFNFMPPFAPPDFEEQVDFESVENFDAELSKAIGTEVIWEDREFFLIKKPNDQTIPKIKKFIRSYWKIKNSTPSV
jgi:hypothetical protein